MEYEKTAKKLTELQAQFGNEDSGDESEKCSDNADVNKDGDLLEALIEREMLLPDSGERRYLRLFKTSFVHKNFTSTIIIIILLRLMKIIIILFSLMKIIIIFIRLKRS